MITKFIPKDQERGVEGATIRNNGMRLKISPHLVLRLGPLKEGPRLNPKKETLTERKAQEIRTNAEGKYWNPNEGRRNIERSVQEVGKTRSEAKKYTKTKVEERRTQRMALCMGLTCSGSVWNSGVYEGGADNQIIVETMEVLIPGIRSEVQWMSGWEPPNVGSKTRNANMIKKV